ncbi:MAG: NAD-dependent protein deacylase [Clostridia bacterium]|nr:NAD-dependent protein deacylase [Clostridia bacterium]
MDTQKPARLADMLSKARRAVFFGGAGVSTESGIPDFRSTDGLYHQQWKYPPETILSHDFFVRKTEEFYDFYRQKMLCPLASPNPAHEALAKLEKLGILSAVITQNIDGLHQAAGSRHVVELHGSVLRNYCTRCGKFFPVDTIQSSAGVPRCGCGGVIKPDVVLYGENLPYDAMEDAVSSIGRADLLIIGGTSLSVYPAAGFVRDYSGPMVIINRSPTPMDHRADLLIDAPIGQTFKAAMQILAEQDGLPPVE